MQEKNGTSGYVVSLLEFYNSKCSFFKKKKIFSCSSRGQKSKIKVSAGLASSEGSLVGLPSHCFLTWSFLYLHVHR